MAIEGLKSSEVPAVAVSPINVADRGELALAVAENLGRVDDRDKFLQGAQEELKELVDKGVHGETVPYLPFGNRFTPKQMIEGIDNANYPDGAAYPQTWPMNQESNNYARRLWFPEDALQEGYSIAEINRLDVAGEGEDEPDLRPSHMRFLLPDGPESEEPLLQMLNMPYDGKYAGEGQQTQLELLEGKIEGFKSDCEGEGIELNPASLSMLAALAMQRRLEGKDMPFEWGFARIPQLGRKALDGDSVVGRVSSGGGRLRLGGSGGDASLGVGVVLSVGLEQDPAA